MVNFAGLTDSRLDPLNSATRVLRFQVVFSDLLIEPTEKYALAKQSRIPAEFIRSNKEQGKRSDPVLGFKKRIFILMDGECGSSCESAISAFEWNPWVKRVGENTADCIHFGNIGYILLPNSKIEIQIPTQYSEYFDHRFIEKIGITPDLRVSPGQDAYDFVRQTLLHVVGMPEF